MFARCYEMAGMATKDRVQIAVGYGVWTAGVGFQLGVERLGAMAIPIGPGNVDMQCQFLEDFQSTVLDPPPRWSPDCRRSGQEGAEKQNCSQEINYGL